MLADKNQAIFNQQGDGTNSMSLPEIEAMLKMMESADQAKKMIKENELRLQLLFAVRNEGTKTYQCWPCKFDRIAFLDNWKDDRQVIEKSGE